MKKQFIAFSTLLMLAAAMKLQSAEPENSLISKSLSVQSADEKFKLSFVFDVCWGLRCVLVGFLLVIMVKNCKLWVLKNFG